MKKTLLFLSMVVTLSFTSTITFAQLYISEVNIGPDSTDDPYEFIEVRGAASSTIAANTYLVFVEGDEGGSTGKVKMYFDLSGLSLGTNGYLAFVMDGHPYATASGATIVTSDLTGNTGWANQSLYVGSGTSGLVEIEDASQNILLVTTSTALSGTGTDIDSNDDGEIDIVGWTIHDGVSILDNDDTTEYGYGAIIFTQARIFNTQYDLSFSNVVEVDFKGGYVCRIGESTGSTAEDWFCASVDDSPVGTIKSSSSDQSFSGLVIAEVGGDSFSSLFTATGYTSGTLTSDGLTDLTFNGAFSTGDDYECHNLTVSSGQTLTIESNGSFEVYGSITNNGGNIVVQSGGTLLTSSGKTVAPITFERTTEYDDDRYSFVGSPVESDIAITGDVLGQDVYSYNETTDFDTDAGLARWEDASSDVLISGVGYTQNFQQDLSFTGVPNSGNIYVDATYTVAGSATSGNRGWNLLSNPYPASIDADDFFLDNTEIDGTVYFWDDAGLGDVRGDDGDYLAWNALGAEVTGPNSTTKFKGDIRSMQGFFVRVTDPAIVADTTVSIVFNEDQRKTGDNDDARFFRVLNEESFPKLRLSLDTQDGTYSNQTLIGLREDATIGIDRMYDALKFSVNGNLKLYSTINNDKYAIQGLPLESGVSTNLGFDLDHSSTELILNITEISGLEEGMTFILTDNLTGEKYDLSDETNIDIFAANGENSDRFSVSYESNQVMSLIAENDEVITYQYNDGVINVHLKNVNIDESKYAIYDMSGRVFLSGESTALQNGSFNVPVNSLKGFYVLKVQFSNDIVKTIKINL